VPKFTFTPRGGAYVGNNDYWTANDAVFPAGAKGTEIGVNDQPVVVYPKNEDEHVFFGGVVRSGYIGAPISLDLFWVSPGTGGDVFWRVAWERDATGKDIAVDTFATEKTVASTAPAIAGKVAKASLLFTQAQADGIVAGDPYRLRVRRDTSDPLDTLDEDAELFRVAVN